MIGNDELHLEKEIVIPAYEGRSIVVPKNSYLKIEDVEGKQVGDFVCFLKDDPTIHVSPVHMRASLSSIRLQKGDLLYSNIRSGLMEFVDDTVGKHDFFFPACDRHRYEVDFGKSDHPNCHDNLRQALMDFSIDPMILPDPINWFMNNQLDEMGDYKIEEPRSKPGDFVILKALEDVVVAVSTCSQDMAPVNGYNVTPLKLQLLRS